MRFSHGSFLASLNNKTTIALSLPRLCPTLELTGYKFPPICQLVLVFSFKRLLFSGVVKALWSVTKVHFIGGLLFFFLDCLKAPRSI